MPTFMKAWAVVCVVLLPLDMIWLKSMRWFYERELGDMLLAQPRIGSAVAFYLIFAAALAYFALLPSLGADSLRQALVAGAFFGFAAYATYDATNHATLKNFTLQVAIVDLAWGTCLAAMGSGFSWLIIKRFGIV